MWLIEKAIANVRYLDEQAGAVIKQEGPKCTYLAYWTWDFYFVVRTDGIATPAPNEGEVILGSTYTIDIHKNTQIFGVPSLSPHPIVLYDYSIPREGGGGWSVDSYTSIFDVKRGIQMTQAIIVGSWNAWAAYGTIVVTKSL